MMEENRVVIVTGASRGIGRGIALELARAGIVPAVHFNTNADAAVETAAECADLLSYSTGSHRDLPIFPADLVDSDARAGLVTDVLSAFDRVDGLVNNAGIAPEQREDIVSAKEEIFDQIISTNLKGPYFLTQLVARYWLDEPSLRTGRIVFITSVSAEMPSVQRGEYCVSKAGLAMASQLFAARLAPDGIPVFEIRPGIIQTDMTAAVRDRYDQRIADGLVPQRRWGQPGDIGKVVRAIMMGDLDFCAGTVIHADGGLHLPRL